MKKSIADLREEYTKASLTTSDALQDPIQQFMLWFENAMASEIQEPNAMNLATINEGRVSSRIVLLKGVEDGEFIFYTNYESDKGSQMEANAHVALNFFWPELERQVRIEGTAHKTSEEVSNAYFKSRPRSSQIGAWVSPQSKPISERDVLDHRLRVVEEQFEGIEVERPKHWGGFAITPNMIEFWQGRPSRLHDRLCYKKVETGGWIIERLAP